MSENLKTIKELIDKYKFKVSKFFIFLFTQERECLL